MRLYRKNSDSYEDRYIPTAGSQAELIEACLSARTWKSAERIHNEVLSRNNEIRLSRVRQHLKHNMHVRKLLDVRQTTGRSGAPRHATSGKAPRIPNNTSKKATLRRPPRKLETLLLPAYGPCPAFAGACRTTVKWNPSAGHVPRGFRGATGRLSEVGLVLVCDTPGNPFPGEGMDSNMDASAYLRTVYTASCGHVEMRLRRFGQNVHYIIQQAWPGMPFDEQFRRTWLTETVLCSPPRSGDPVPPAVERECMERYLFGQLALLPNARVVGLGWRAQGRLKKAGIAFRSAPHPSTRISLTEARKLWSACVSGLAV